MALYDSQVKNNDFLNEALPKSNENAIFFSDGGFYPYLKYLINQTTKIPNSHIYIRDYGENNPFLEQSKAPKVYCELYEFNTPCMTGNFDGYGDMHLFAQTKYRVYFVNDNFRAPFLFEATMKGNVDNIDKISKDFIKAYEEYKKKFNTPLTITMSSRKEHKGFSTYPILIYDILMNGYITQNIRELENIPFDSVELGIILKKE